MEHIDFVKKFPLRPFKKGELLLREGDAADTLLALQTGFVKVTTIFDDGSQRLLSIAGRYDVVPVEQLFSTRSDLRFFYTAMSDGSAYHVDKQTFLHHAADQPSLMNEIARGISQHHDELLDRLLVASNPTVQTKLTAVLGYIAQRFSADTIVDLHTLGLRLTHQDIAEMIGATRETTSLALEVLRRDGVIDYSRDHFVIHTDQLAAMTEHQNSPR
jgi:CRP/FNR family transcriptional regulator, cyclic AMP receptor protein